MQNEDKKTPQLDTSISEKIRFHQTRLMIVSNGLSASEAAYKVGYNNASQFSWEFKRQF